MKRPPVGPLDVQSVAVASAAWLWYPEDAPRVETEDYLLVRWPPWFEGDATLLRIGAGRTLAVVLDEACERARELGAQTLEVWVREVSPAGLEPLLRERGATIGENIDVMAIGIAGRAPDLAPAPEVELWWVTTADGARDQHGVHSTVFGSEVPDAAQLARSAAESAADLDAGRGGSLTAYLHGRPVGAAGLALVDGVARLWGGGVVEGARGRGIYRALLAARLAYAVERGAHLALVKGRVETSGPILRRAGFEVFGREVSYTLPL